MTVVLPVRAPPSQAPAGGGQLIHNQLFSISGSGFGTKSRAIAPILRDVGTAATGTVDAQWGGHVPFAATTDPNFNLQNQNVGFSPTGAAIGAPHAYVPRILAGGAGDHTPNANTAYNIGMWVPYDRPSAAADYVLYSSMYYRADPNWTFEIGFPNDNNFKTYAINGGYNGLYNNGGTQFGYLNYVDASGRNNSIVSVSAVTDGQNTATSGFMAPDANGHNAFWGASLWPFNPANGWIKQEIEIYCTASATAGPGRIDMFENASRTSIIGYRGWTDLMPGTQRSWLFGGYNRDYGASGANNYRYFSDIYFDISGTGAVNVARVMVGNNPVYASCTVCEPSVPATWTAGSITFTFWKGKLTGGSTGYIFVQTENGTIVPAGSATIAASP